MPSSLRIDPPSKKPKAEDYTDGEAFERAMDDWADAEAKRKPGVFIKKFHGSRDGDTHHVHVTKLHEDTGQAYQTITKKTGETGADNGAFQRQVEDKVGEDTDDNAFAVAEGEMARVRAEEGLTFVNDMVKAARINELHNMGPVFKLITPEGAERPTHMARAYLDHESEEWVVAICEISHYSMSERDFVPNPATLVEHRQGVSVQDQIALVRPEDRIVLL